MNHLIDKAEAYARHFLLEQNGYKNQADGKFSELRQALIDHSQAVSRASLVAYREGRSGSPASPNYAPWEWEAWECGRDESR